VTEQTIKSICVWVSSCILAGVAVAMTKDTCCLWVLVSPVMAEAMWVMFKF